MKKVLLVNPPVYDFTAFDLWSKPLGLLYLSSILKQNNIETALLDYMDRNFGGADAKSDASGRGHYIKKAIPKPNAYAGIPRMYSRFGISKEQAEGFLQSIQKPDIILVTSIMTYWYPGVIEAVKTVKEFFPGIPLALGGIYATLCDKHAASTGADFIVQGELSSLNTVFRKVAIDIDIPDNFDDFPIPDFSYYPKSKYASIRMSMGCPFRCSYCAQDVLCGGKYHIKSWKKVFVEIKELYDKGIKNIAFYDDALFFNSGESIKPLLRNIIEKNIKISIHTPNGLHAKYLDFELASLMKEAGFVMPRFSLETTDSFSQKETGGKITNDGFVNAVRTLNKAGYARGEYIVYLLIGMPGQTLKSVEESIWFVHNLGAKISLSEYSVIPKTKDFAKIDPAFEKEPLYHNKTAYPLFKPDDRPEVNRVKNLAIKLNSLL